MITTEEKSTIIFVREIATYKTLKENLNFE
jgi:hypothetical protein